jgi:tetratricopeptide (TPR) repeat protein
MGMTTSKIGAHAPNALAGSTTILGQAWEKAGPRQPALVAAALIVGTMLLYARTLGNDFVNYDDGTYITRNLEVQKGFNLENIIWAWTTIEGANWHPLTWMSLEFDYQLFGLNPAGFHFTNMLLHAASAGLLFGVLWLWTRAMWRSALVAALFAWHPLRVESVAWAAERKDVLCGFFFMLSLWAYARYVQSEGTRKQVASYLMVTLAVALGLLAKPMLVTVPFLLLLLDYWPLLRLNGHLRRQGDESSSSGRRRGDRLDYVYGPIVEKIPLLCLVAAAAVLTFYAQHTGKTVISMDAIGLKLRIENAIISYVRYLIMLVWPSSLAVFYPYPGSDYPLWQASGAAILLIGLTGIALLYAAVRPYMIVGWLWYLASLVPVIGLIQVGAQALADRYTYLPAIGVFLAVVWLGADVCRVCKVPSIVCGAVCSAMLAIFCLVTWHQEGIWRDGMALWQHALAVTPGNYVAYTDYGYVLSFSERLEEAREYFLKAHELRLDLAEPHYNLAAVCEKLDSMDEARQNYERAIQLKPDYAECYFQLGRLLAKEGKTKEAIPYYEKATAIKPNYAEAEEGLAWALSQQGLLDDSIMHYGKALQSKPNDANLLCNLGLVLTRLGRTSEAIDQFHRALQDDPEMTEARQGMAECFVAEGRLGEAIQQCESVLEKDDSNAKVRTLLGAIRQQQGDWQGAEECFRQALQYDPNMVEALNGLGSVFWIKGDLEKAREHFERAIRLNPSSTVGQSNLGMVLAQQGKFDEAARHYGEALQGKPDDVVSRAKFGINLYRAGKQAEALDQFRRVNQTAWQLATNPDPRIRNGRLALGLVQPMVQVTKERDAELLDTMGAAWAELGNFPEARRVAQKALELLKTQDAAPQRTAIEKHLQSYELGQPFRESDNRQQAK